jgi:hypothetical protein
MNRVWYVAYGSNLERGRFRCYLEGGVPPGGRREYAGCSDPTDPADDIAVELPGRLVFAGSSTVWGGGMAFYDPAGDGRVAGRAYLLTGSQLADVVAQEMRRDPDGPFARRLLAALSEVERVHVLGPGRYETLVRLADLAGRPAFTVTSDDVGNLVARPPTAPYLRTIASGLRSAHAWRPSEIADYLWDAVGVRDAWSREDLETLARPVAAK